MIRRAFLATAFAALAAPALAHGPTPQQLTKVVQVAAPPDKVWAVIADPAAMADWQPDIVNVTMQGEGRGAKRTVEFKAGGTLLDGIDKIDADKMNIRWRLSREDIAVFPASFYTNDVTVAPRDGGSEVTWHASLYRADTTNEPAEEYNDEAAVAAMEAFIDHGLAGIKAAAEK